MAIKVVHQRKIRTENKEELGMLLARLRTAAVSQPGYLSGETLVALDDQDSHLVISTWQTLQEWMAWEDNRERRILIAMIDKLLVEPATVRVFIDASASLSWQSLAEGC
jgi:antibiotic biosynthesis monooxygenase (ABM) superfamily enzyme